VILLGGVAGVPVPTVDEDHTMSAATADSCCSMLTAVQP
jgi:hypothetical protein